MHLNNPTMAALIPKPFIRWACNVVLIALVCTPLQGHADAAPAEGLMGIRVRVRAVRALGLVPNAQVQHAALASGGSAASAEESCSQRLDSALSDISAKLKALQYRDYKIASSQEVIVPLMKKRAMYLHDGNVLLVRPLYAEGESIGLWLRWVDGAGTRLLDTRMHFNERETMLAGAELSATDGRASDTATVLAIDVSPAQRSITARSTNELSTE